jgi:F0F1-type ATP synthase membrane subunit c/vacuolar-type H+-ATPase subunit K
MEPVKEQETIDQRYQRLRVVWSVLLTSQFFLFSVVFFTKNDLFKFEFTEPLSGKNPVMILVLALLAVTSFSLSFLMRTKMLKQAEMEQTPDLVQTALIISCALCESISLLGLVLAFALEYQYFFIWFALGILGIILHFPRKKDLERASYKLNNVGRS